MLSPLSLQGTRMKAVEWIDRVKDARGWETDYRAAKELGVSHAALSRYRSRPDSTMDDVVAARVAQALDLEPHIIVMDQVAERTPEESVRASLAELLARLTKRRKGPRLGGGGQVDITSAASIAPGGEPERQWAPALKTMACDPGESVPRQHKVHIVSTTAPAWQHLVNAVRCLILPPGRALGA